MAQTIKILGQSAPTAATATTLYTVPASTSTVVSTIMVCNTSATATSFRINFQIAGAADTAAQYIAYDAAIAGNTSVSFTIGATLAATDVIRIYATLATLSFTAFGTEIV